MPNDEFPLVSIVIPCFNSQDYLEETLDSVRTQTLTDWELILINDGSTDRTGEILEAEQRRGGRKILVRSTTNQGVSRARNLGISLCRGRFIQFLDADDLLAPDALAKKVAALEADGADIAFGDFQRLVQDQNGGFVKGEIALRNMEDYDADVATAFVQGFWIPPAGLLFRKSLVDRLGGFDERFPIVQDGRYLFEAGRSGARWVKVEGTLAFYREYGRSLSKKDKSAFLRDSLNNILDIEELWEKENAPMRKVRREALLDRYFHYASYFYEHDRPLFDEILRRIRNLDPNSVPTATPLLRVFSIILGYPRAEAVALAWRKTKRIFNRNP